MLYLNTDYAPVKHPFKASFDIESHNSMLLDKSLPLTSPLLETIFKDSLPPAIESKIVTPIAAQNAEHSG